MRVKDRDEQCFCGRKGCFTNDDNVSQRIIRLTSMKKLSNVTYDDGNDV